MKKYILFALFSTAFNVAFSQPSISAEEAINHIGETVTVCGKIFGGRFLQNTTTRPTLLNVGGDYPNHFLAILIREEDRKNFSYKPEERYLNKDICVTGKIIEYRGKPEIIVSYPYEIVIKEEEAILTGKKVDNRDKVAKSAPVNNSTTTTKSATLDPTAVKSKSGAAPTGAENIGYTVSLSSEVNLREGPSLEDRVVAVVKKGSVVTIYKSGNGWSYVSVKREGAEDVVHGFMKNSVIK